jgi:hypothetical protein
MATELVVEGQLASWTRLQLIAAQWVASINASAKVTKCHWSRQIVDPV